MTEAAPVGAATSFARPAHPGFWPLPAVAAKDDVRTCLTIAVIIADFSTTHVTSRLLLPCPNRYPMKLWTILEESR